MDEIRLGREMTSVMTHQLTAIDEVVTIKANSHRVGLTIFADINGFQTVNSPTVEQWGNGYAMAGGQQPLKLNVKDDGDIVMAQWQVWSRQVGMVCYIETFLSRQ